MSGELVAGLDKEFAGIEQRLARNASLVEAGAAEGVALFDDGDARAELCGTDCCNIATGAAADNDQVINITHNLLRKLAARNAKCETRKIN